MQWYLRVLKLYATFSGRARRREFWMFYLIDLVMFFFLAFVDWMIGAVTGGEVAVPVLGAVYFVAIFVPSIAVTVRRLHDTGRTGWWVLLAFIPFVNLVMLIFFVQDSEPEPNKYGPNPKAVPGEPAMAMA